MRILSLHPSTTELVFALGAGNSLVGRTDRCTYPEAALNVPSIGDPAAISTETIALFEPDLILVGYGQENLKAMHGAKSVLLVSPQSVAELLEKINSLGDALGKEVEAQLVIHDIQSIFESIRSKAAKFHKTRVYLEQERSLAPPTFVDELIRVAGGEPTRAMQNPQVIIAAAQEEELVERIAHRKGWEQLQAIRHERLFLVEEQLLQPTPRVVFGLKQLAKILHGVNGD